MNCRQKTVLCGLVFVVLASPLKAQSASCQTRELPVVVRDSGGLPIDQIAAADFAGKIKGKPVPIISITPGVAPKRAVILLDTSGSMAGIRDSQKWKLALLIANQFANALDTHGRLAFLAFNETVHDRIDFSQSNQAVLAHLKKRMGQNDLPAPQVRGRTALFDAVHAGMELLGNPSAGDVLFVITDGGDNASKLKQELLERELIANRVRFYSVLVFGTEDENRSPTPEEMNAPDALAELSRATGGEVFGPVGYRRGNVLSYGRSPSGFPYNDKTTVEKALMMFYEGLFHQKILKLELPPPANKKVTRFELKFSESAHQKWKGVVVSYPEKLLPCETLEN